MRISSVCVLAFFLFIHQHQQNLIECTQQQPPAIASVKADSPNYRALMGSSFTMTWIGTNMQENDVVLRFYSGSIGLATTIYTSGSYQNGMNAKFNVFITRTSASTISISLTFLKVSASDSAYNYRCQCNEYTTFGCSSTEPTFSADSTLLIFTTTTPTTKIMKHLYGDSNNQNGLCIEGDYNTAQYVLIFLTFFILVLATLLFYYPFYGLPYNQMDNRLEYSSIVETFFLVLVIIISFFSIIASIIFWINPALIDNSNIVSTIIVSLGLFACAILWIFNLQYVIRLCLKDQISLIIVVLIAVDSLLEIFSGALLLAANVYCGGYSSIISFNSFNYSFMEIVGATFVLIFASFLLLIAGVLFFMTKKRKTVEMFNRGFDKLPSRSIAASSAISKQGIITELLFVDNKITPMPDLNKNETTSLDKQSFLSSRTIVKPGKLTPIFTRKLSDDKQQQQQQQQTCSSDNCSLVKERNDDIICLKSTEINEKLPATITTTTENVANRSVSKQTNPFTAIWDTNSILAPMNNENPIDRDKRRKSMNGARKVKSDTNSTLKSESVLSNSAISGTIVNSQMTLKEYEMSTTSSSNNEKPVETRSETTATIADSSKHLDEQTLVVDDQQGSGSVKRIRKKSSKKSKKGKKKKRVKKDEENANFVDDFNNNNNNNPILAATAATADLNDDTEAIMKNPNQSLESKLN